MVGKIYLIGLVFIIMSNDLYSQDSIYYDSVGRVTSYSYPNGYLIIYTYDPLGNRLSKTMTILSPAAAGSVSGPAAVCSGDDSVSFSVPQIQYAMWYIWSLPAGASIVSGDSTQSIRVTFSAGAQSGNITVYGKNEGGSGPVSPVHAIMVMTVPAAPGTISGPAGVQQDQSGVVYSIAATSGATGYTWSFPAGATITAGNGTPSVTVSFGSSAVSGSISVSAYNSCGTGAVSPAFSLTVSAGVPATQAVQNTTVSAGQTVCYQATQMITVAGGGTTFLVQNGGHASLMAGQKISFLAGAKVNAGGYLHGYITTTGQYCYSTKSAENGGEEGLENERTIPSHGTTPILLVYPNPTGNSTMVRLTGPRTEQSAVVRMSNLFGEELGTWRLAGSEVLRLDLSPYPPGIYLLNVTMDARCETVKIVRQ